MTDIAVVNNATAKLRIFQTSNLTQCYKGILWCISAISKLHLFQTSNLTQCYKGILWCMSAMHCRKRRKCYSHAFSSFLTMLLKCLIPEGCLNSCQHCTMFHDISYNKFFAPLSCLTVSQTKNSRLFQTERVCRWQFQRWKCQKVLQMGRKDCGKRINCMLQAISPFPTAFQKIYTVDSVNRKG